MLALVEDDPEIRRLLTGLLAGAALHPAPHVAAPVAASADLGAANAWTDAVRAQPRDVEGPPALIAWRAAGPP